MPLSQEALTKIRQQVKDAEDKIKEVTKDINEARRAGLDVTEQVKRVEALKHQVSQIKTVYGVR